MTIATSYAKALLLTHAILNGNLLFLEGAVQILAIKGGLGEVADRDPDFDVFLMIQSETDNLPLEAQRKLWSPDALAELESNIRQAEVWAKSFAPSVCRNLIVRFGSNWPDQRHGFHSATKSGCADQRP